MKNKNTMNTKIFILISFLAINSCKTNKFNRTINVLEANVTEPNYKPFNFPEADVNLP